MLNGLHLPGGLVLVLLAGLGALGWLALRLARRRKPDAAALSEEPAFAAWSEAACPACLAITAVRQVGRPNVHD